MKKEERTKEIERETKIDILSEIYKKERYSERGK